MGVVTIKNDKVTVGWGNAVKSLNIFDEVIQRVEEQEPYHPSFLLHCHYCSIFAVFNVISAES
jgi:hypothetical protein